MYFHCWTRLSPPGRRKRIEFAGERTQPEGDEKISCDKAIDDLGSRLSDNHALLPDILSQKGGLILPRQPNTILPTSIRKKSETNTAFQKPDQSKNSTNDHPPLASNLSDEVFNVDFESKDKQAIDELEPTDHPDYTDDKNVTNLEKNLRTIDTLNNDEYDKVVDLLSLSSASFSVSGSDSGENFGTADTNIFDQEHESGEGSIGQLPITIEGPSTEHQYSLSLLGRIIQCHGIDNTVSDNPMFDQTMADIRAYISLRGILQENNVCECDLSDFIETSELRGIVKDRDNMIKGQYINVSLESDQGSSNACTLISLLLSLSWVRSTKTNGDTDDLVPDIQNLVDFALEHGKKLYPHCPTKNGDTGIQCGKNFLEEVLFKSEGETEFLNPTPIFEDVIKIRNKIVNRFTKQSDYAAMCKLVVSDVF